MATEALPKLPRKLQAQLAPELQQGRALKSAPEGMKTKIHRRAEDADARRCAAQMQQ